MNAKLFVEKDVPIQMRDGTILRADIYRPDSSERLPVLLTRTPYGKAISNPNFALMAAERGYVVVVQDTRGRWSSEGIDYPFLYEKDDGFDTVQWAARLPWADGQVGMFGGSYVGYTQWAALNARPPALKTIAPAITFRDPRAGSYQGGEFVLGPAVSWALLAGAQMAIQRLKINPTEKLPLWGQLIALVDGMRRGETFLWRPLMALPLVGEGGLVRYLNDAFRVPVDDPLWQKIDCTQTEIHLPVFQISGWYDSFLSSSLRDYASVQEQQDRPFHKLVIGPWTHGSFENLSGEFDFGVQSSGLFVMPEEMHLRWFDAWLKGVPNGLLEEPPVRLFVMGANTWRNENEWPLARTNYVPFYLHSNGSANSLVGDGVLTREKPAMEAQDTFLYNPHNPVPTRGGGLCCWNAALPPGAFDQREVEKRPDVLVYTTSPFEKEIEVTGPLQVNLWASTSAVDTDFTAKLVDVSPDGYARNLADGICRAAYQLSSSQASRILPGEMTLYTIDLGATSNLFKAGHCIRLEISSSNFPRFARNPNTGQHPAEAVEFQTAQQTIYHDIDHPSHILLPVIL